MLSASRSFKVVKKLLNQGVVSKTFLQKYKERMAPVVAAIRSKPVHEPDDTEYWEGIRNLFAYNDDTDCVPINAANLCPNFESVQQTVNDLQLELNLDVSIQKRVDVFSLVIDNAREEIAQQLGVGSDEIALMRNTSEANCAINNGVELNEGDEVRTMFVCKKSNEVVSSEPRRRSMHAWSLANRTKNTKKCFTAFLA